ncbi:MAG: dipeptidase [Cyclobacteriaceae bacterium]
MKNILLMLIAMLLVFSCGSPEKPGEKELSDEDLRAKADELAHKFIIVDGHVDLPFRMEVKGFMLKKEVEDVSKLTEGNFDYPKAKKGGLDAPFMSIYVPSGYQRKGGAKEFADSLISMTTQVATTYPDQFALARNPTDIRQNFENGVISLPLGMENGAPIEDDIANVKYFYDRGIRYITLTHSKDNQISDSSYDTVQTWKGLSPFGEEVVAEMNRVGIMVDVSHISDSAFYDVMKIVKAPVIASHSSARKFTPGFQRNMDDDMLKKLAENGGVIHINFGSSFLSKESRDKFNAMREHLTNYRVDNKLKEEDQEYKDYEKQYKEKYIAENNPFENITTAAEHIDHVVKLIGIDYVAFGSDFDGVGDSLPEGLKDVSMYPNLIYQLLKMGYSEEDIEKICYKNTFRVWNKVIEVAQQ